MEGENAVSTNKGDGENSYANNSQLQELVILKVKPLLKETLTDMFRTALPKCIKLADLGCSSGPNSLLVISEILEIVQEMCLNSNREESKHEVQMFLNDLPGSFYGRLFPTNSMHFFHSSYSLHWLSKVPDGLNNNKGNISLASTSPPDVYKAYLQQFKTDFSLFLSSRAEELVPGGRIMATFKGRKAKYPCPSSYEFGYEIQLLSKSLIDLIEMGLIKQEDLEKFNLPVYTPYEGEVMAVIEEEGSFHVDRLRVFEANWDPNDREDSMDFEFDKHQGGHRVAAIIRAVTEPLLASHFGYGKIMDMVFNRYEMHVADHLCLEKTKHINIVLTMTKKTIEQVTQ